MTKSNTAKVMVGNCQSLSVIPCVSRELFKDVRQHSALNHSGPAGLTEAYFKAPAVDPEMNCVLHCCDKARGRFSK